MFEADSNSWDAAWDGDCSNRIVVVAVTRGIKLRPMKDLDLGIRLGSIVAESVTQMPGALELKCD